MLVEIFFYPVELRIALKSSIFIPLGLSNYEGVAISGQQLAISSAQQKDVGGAN